MIAAIKDVGSERHDGQPLTCPISSVSGEHADSNAEGNARKVSPRCTKYRFELPLFRL